MDSTKVLSVLAASQVPEITTFTAAADVAGSLSGKMLNCTNALGIVQHYIIKVDGIAWSSAIQATVIAANQATDKYWTVSIAPGAADTAVATAFRAAINANAAASDQYAGGTTTGIIVYNRRGGVAGVASTTDTGFTMTRTQTGTTVLTTDAGNLAGTNLSYKYIPAPGTRAFINQISMSIGTAAMTVAGQDITKFGSITALAGGVIVRVMTVLNTVKTTLATIKSNQDLVNLSTRYEIICGAAKGACVGHCDTVQAFGEAIEVDGTAGEYLEFFVVNATTGTAALNFGLNGKVK